MYMLTCEKKTPTRPQNTKAMFGFQKVWGKCEGKKIERKSRKKKWRKIKNRFKVNELFLRTTSYFCSHLNLLCKD